MVNILRELEAKAKYVDWDNEHRKVYYVLFSANGFTDELKLLAESRSDVILAE